MAKIFPFRGLRPRPDLAKDVSALPYDVVTREEARKYAEGNPNSFFHVSRPEIALPDDTDPYSDLVYQTGRKNLDRFINGNVFLQDPEDRMYLYTQVMGTRQQTGLVACFSIDDYTGGIIKKHEHTIEAKEKDRTRHLDILNANTGLVFLFYREDGGKKPLFERIMKKTPLYDFIAQDGIRHIVRMVDNAGDIEAFAGAFAGETLFIADGHHRAASAVAVGLSRRERNKNHTGSEQYNRFLAVAFPHDELKIYPYNRAVRDLSGMAAPEFLKKVSSLFPVKKSGIKEPSKKGEVSMLLDGSWYTLAMEGREGADLVDNLDVMILQKRLLEPLLGIRDPRRDKRIDFIGGVDGLPRLERAVSSGEFAAAFSLFPTSVEDLMEISSRDGVMPPKSTWFEPKLRSGLFLHPLD